MGNLHFYGMELNRIMENMTLEITENLKNNKMKPSFHEIEGKNAI